MRATLALLIIFLALALLWAEFTGKSPFAPFSGSGGQQAGGASEPGSTSERGTAITEHTTPVIRSPNS